jgi:hypothetical protein
MDATQPSLFFGDIPDRHPHAERSAQGLSRQGDEHKLVITPERKADSERTRFDRLVVDDHPLGT